MLCGSTKYYTSKFKDNPPIRVDNHQGGRNNYPKRKKIRLEIQKVYCYFFHELISPCLSDVSPTLLHEKFEMGLLVIDPSFVNLEGKDTQGNNDSSKSLALYVMVSRL